MIFISLISIRTTLAGGGGVLHANIAEDKLNAYKAVFTKIKIERKHRKWFMYIFICIHMFINFP